MGWFAVVLFVAVLAASLVGTRLVLWLLRHRSILDLPNERSSHRVATPRGGGLAVVAVLIVAWLAIGFAGTPDQTLTSLILCGAALGLGVVSWIDDLKGLAVAWRLVAQSGAVAIAVMALPGDGPYWSGLLPAGLDAVAAGLLWLWFINLFNFMDGIDGLAGAETVSLGAGVAVVAVAAGMGDATALYGLTALAAALGFLKWNWHPARIFLGDVGSVPLGFLLGWLLLDLSARGYWASALILSLYYLADASITLVRRGVRGAAVWRAHREHFYQRAVDQGRRHDAVVGAVICANLGFIVLAVLAALDWRWPALAGAAAVVSALLFHLGPGMKGPPAETPANDQRQ
jgi:UDP-N-acetylmuramyl pentapeptide phosphotransferase/UDP-N-acetylglucosamine-1-phosphate transferase